MTMTQERTRVIWLVSIPLPNKIFVRRTVALYRTQSFQNCVAENFFLRATVTPNKVAGPMANIPADEW